MERPSPDIFDYDCYREYVRDFFGNGRGEWSTGKFVMSYRNFLKRIGQGAATHPTCSPCLITRVKHRERHFSIPLAQMLCAHGRLVRTPREKDYFMLLVKRDHAAHETDRHRLEEERLALRSFHRSLKLDPETRELFTRWYLPAILELTHCLGFEADAERIGRILRPPVPATEVRWAIERLQMLGLIQPNPTGSLAGPEGSIVIEPDKADSSAGGPYEARQVAWPSAPLTAWYKSVLEQAKWAVTETPSAERQFHSITSAVPAHAVPRLRAELDAFVKRVLHICSATPGPCEQVYQLTFYYLPVTSTFQSLSETPGT